MFSTTKYYNKYVLKAITQNLVIHPVLNPVRTCGKYSNYNANTGMLQWCHDHTGTHSHIGKHEYHPGTQDW